MTFYENLVMQTQQNYSMYYQIYQQRFGIMNVIQGCFYDYPTDDDRKELLMTRINSCRNS